MPIRVAFLFAETALLLLRIKDKLALSMFPILEENATKPKAKMIPFNGLAA